MIPKDKNRDKKIEEIVKKAATRFLLEEAGNNSLITVTHVEVSPKAEYATIFITVFPALKEKEAIDFAKRKRSEFKEYVRNETRLQRIPFFDFHIDIGEKNRQNIESISQTLN